MFPGEVEDNNHPSWNSKQDLDIYIPSRSIAIQYDGYPHDEKKYKTDLKNGEEVVCDYLSNQVKNLEKINLIRVKKLVSLKNKNVKKLRLF